MNIKKNILLTIICFFKIVVGFAQSDKYKVEGEVLDENNVPISGAMIFNNDEPNIKKYTDTNGKFSLRLSSSSFKLICKSEGFEDYEEEFQYYEGINLKLKLNPIKININLALYEKNDTLKQIKETSLIIDQEQPSNERFSKGGYQYNFFIKKRLIKSNNNSLSYALKKDNKVISRGLLFFNESNLNEKIFYKTLSIDLNPIKKVVPKNKMKMIYFITPGIFQFKNNKTNFIITALGSSMLLSSIYFNSQFNKKWLEARAIGLSQNSVFSDFMNYDRLIVQQNNLRKIRNISIVSGSGILVFSFVWNAVTLIKNKVSENFSISPYVLSNHSGVCLNVSL